MCGGDGDVVWVERGGEDVGRLGEDRRGEGEGGRGGGVTVVGLNDVVNVEERRLVGDARELLDDVGGAHLGGAGERGMRRGSVHTSGSLPVWEQGICD